MPEPVGELSWQVVGFRDGFGLGEPLVHRHTGGHVRHELFRDRRREAEIDDGFRALSRALGRLAARRSQLGHRLAEQPGVEVEADGVDVAALLGAEDVAGPAYLEVLHGDAEPGAEFRSGDDRLQPALRGLREPASALHEQVGVRALGAAADASAELVQLRQAEGVRPVHNEGVDRRDVEP